MRIIRRPAFLALPAGTVYAAYSPCTFDALRIKGDTVGNDFYCADLVGAVAWGTSGDFFERCAAMEHGASFPAFFENWGRDAQFEGDDRMYAIYERADIDRLVKTLQKDPVMLTTTWDGRYAVTLPDGRRGEMTLTGPDAYDMRAGVLGVATVSHAAVTILWGNGTTWIITRNRDGALGLQTADGHGAIEKP